MQLLSAKLFSITNISMDSLLLEYAESLLEEIPEYLQPQVERHANPDDAAPRNSESLRRMDMNSEGRLRDSMKDDSPVLQSKHKIFLSHSGAQKNFVEHLCKDLEKRHHFPSFDGRSSSLPKGERFPELIIKAAQQCHMAIVVVSEEYFVSKWSMIELHTFVQARLRLNPKLKILPLFYKLSMNKFGNKERKDQWFKKWEDWAKIDLQININEWKNMLNLLTSFNGLDAIQIQEELKPIFKSLYQMFAKKFLQILNGMIHMFKEASIYSKYYCYNYYAFSFYF